MYEEFQLNDVPQNTSVRGQTGDSDTDVVVDPDQLFLVRGKLAGGSLELVLSMRKCIIGSSIEDSKAGTMVEGMVDQP